MDDAPAPASRYDRLRRRLAPIAVVIALIVLVRETLMSKRDVTRGTIELRFGAHAAEVSHVRATVFDDGAPVGHLERDLRADPSTPVRFPAELSERARVVVDLSTTAGPRRFEHALAAGEVVVVDLGPDLDLAAH